ncbi:MAG: MFS transporter [Armatimonadia bacterium]
MSNSSPQPILLSPTGHPVAYMRLMIASVLCMVMFGAVQVMPTVCLDALGRDMCLNFEQRGFLIAIRMAALTACLLVVGHFGERPGKRFILFVGLAAISVGQIMAARAPGYSVLLAAFIVSGLGYGVVEAYLNPIVAQLHPHGSARALNILNGIFSLGLVLGALTTGEMLQAGLGWRLPFWVWVLPPLVIGILYLTPHYPAPVHGSDDVRPTPDVRRFISLPLFWVLFGAMILGGGCEAGLTNWAPNYVAEVLKATARGGAWTTILYGTFMAVGRLGSGLVVSKTGAIKLMVLSAIACGVVTAALTFVPSMLVAWVLFALSGLFVACFWPTLLSIGSDQIAPGSTSLLSLLGAAGVSGCVIVPWAIGALGDLFGLRLAMLVLPTSMILLIILLATAAGIVHRHKNGTNENGD